MKTLAAVALLALSFATVPALAQEDVVSYGGGVHVPRGQVVADAISFGGDAVIEGDVRGDAVSFGGSVILREGARVDGEITSFGGAVIDERSGAIAPLPHASEPRGAHQVAHEATRWERAEAAIKDGARGAVAHVLLFLLGLLMLGLGRERLSALQITMVRDGLETAGVGLLGFVAAGVAIVLLALTVIGIPFAIVLGLAVPVVTYVGLAAAATVIGAALPVRQLHGREVAQLGAGVFVLFVASLVPVFGTAAQVVAACLGFGAVLRTRLGVRAPEGPPEEVGPYRTGIASGA